jgi:hypothetical protein
MPPSKGWRRTILRSVWPRKALCTLVAASHLATSSSLSTFTHDSTNDERGSWTV